MTRALGLLVLCAATLPPARAGEPVALFGGKDTARWYTFLRDHGKGKDPNGTPVREVMTPEVVYCFEDDDVRDAARKMEEHQIRRLIVLTRDKRLAGIVALGDIAVHAPSDRLAGEITEAVSEPGNVER